MARGSAGGRRAADPDLKRGRRGQATLEVTAVRGHPLWAVTHGEAGGSSPVSKDAPEALCPHSLMMGLYTCCPREESRTSV